MEIFPSENDCKIKHSDIMTWYSDTNYAHVNVKLYNTTAQSRIYWYTLNVLYSITCTK